MSAKAKCPESKKAASKKAATVRSAQMSRVLNVASKPKQKLGAERSAASAGGASRSPSASSRLPKPLVVPMSLAMLRDLDRFLATPVAESCRDRRGSCATYGDVVSLIQSTGSRVHIVGGAVRDLVRLDASRRSSGGGAKTSSGGAKTSSGGPKSSEANAPEFGDMDLLVTSPRSEELLGAIKSRGLAGGVVDFRDDPSRADDGGGGFFFLFVGCGGARRDASGTKGDEDYRVEAVHAEGAPPGLIMETPCNSLRIDLADRVIVDPTGGAGIEDARAEPPVWRVPPHVKSDSGRRAWVVQKGVMRLWRMIKFRDLKGFRVPEADQRLIYEVCGDLVERGAVPPRDFFLLGATVRDPSAWACAILGDAVGHGAGANKEKENAGGEEHGAGVDHGRSPAVVTAEAALSILRAIFQSGEVVVPAHAVPGPKTVARICGARELRIEGMQAGPGARGRAPGGPGRAPGGPGRPGRAPGGQVVRGGQGWAARFGFG